MKTVVVESPAKAKTINKYLGKDYKVLASFGHVRDLPSKNGSVDPDNDFAMIWEVDSDAKKRIKDIADATKSSDELILATDPDREGEAISWHVLELLKAKRGVMKDVTVKRVVFNEITKSAILKAMDTPRDIDEPLVDAYLARRALDYLVGFNLSPVLWRKLPGSRSAGRVQSVSLRLICDRELEIEQFKSEEYWTIDVNLSNGAKDSFSAQLSVLNGEKVKKFTLTTQSDATAAEQIIKGAAFSISNVESKPARRYPAPPFTTSTLQQEAARKLGFNAQRTMRCAQKLYEGIDIGGETVGLITYMRTDGVNIAKEAIFSCRDVITSEYGENYVPAKPRFYKSKAKNTQEAHEAVRPTSLKRMPKHVAARLDEDQRRLYELIWKRTIASQMAEANFERTTVDILSDDGKCGLRSTGSVQVFDGFLKLYQEGQDDKAENNNGDENDRRLPKLTKGENVNQDKVTPVQHFTAPPPRFTEASLVKTMEELGIGRPSTYASVLTVLRDRNYVVMDKNRFVPEDKGRLVTSFLQNYFAKYVEFDFTANMEELLDKVSNGDIPWKKVLADFWLEFHEAIEGTKDLRVSEVLEKLNQVLAPFIFPEKEDGSNARACPKCADGILSLKTSRYGAFIGCSHYPECNYTRKMNNGNGEDAEEQDTRQLGIDPETKMEVTIRTGRFGPYVQLGEPVEKEKPKRSSVPKGMDAASVDLEKALKLLSLPRTVGNHPADGKEIKTSIGRYGPYVAHAGIFASLKDPEDVFNLGINHAVELLDLAKKKKGGAAEPIKELGNHPDDGEPVKVFEGRYGPYVKHNRINATIPKGKDPLSVTLEEAVELIKARAAKGKKKPAKKPAKKKAAPKKKSKS
ncbi:DNA topoisomerase I [hydrothermal vent metagenome]|uniref:DNA topoisomerase n=1 Tax=hydrothermal vent metagenome TaxID=652676 RepID=A0A3B0SYH9_9ZZZZ